MLPLEQFNSEVQWKVDGTQVSVSLPNARFSNADAQGEAQIKWHSGELPEGVAPGEAGDKRFPGVLDLQGTLARFFADVMVMAEEPAVRANRLALLTRLRKLFLHVADDFPSKLCLQ